jgi:hypothetical protein
MTSQDGPRLAAVSNQSPSSESLASTSSSGKTLRDEEVKDLEAWSSSSSPRKQLLNKNKDQDFDDEGSDEDDHLLAIPTTPPLESNRVPSPLIFEEDQKLPLKNKKKTATWKSLPRKGQLALLTISRLAEPLTQTSLQSYMFYQLKSFDMSQTDSQISVQAGMLAAAFTAAQFVTAIPWGRAADSELFGRKRVLIIGLLGTMISAVGFGFSRSFYTAMFFRTLGGALNGNVGVMRTVGFAPIFVNKASTADQDLDDIRDHKGEKVRVILLSLHPQKLINVDSKLGPSCYFQ